MSELLKYLLSTQEQFRRARLPALYSDFRHLRTINPDGFKANISAWLDGIAAATRAGVLPSHNLLVLSTDEQLVKSLETKEWGRPLALGTVIREAVIKRDLIPYEEFVKQRESIYHRRWGLQLPGPWDVLTWAWRQIGLGWGADGQDTLPVGALVVVENVKDAGKGFAHRVDAAKSRVDRVWTKGRFCDEFRDVLGTGSNMSEKDMDVLLRFLETDVHLVSYDGHTVKLRVAGEEKAMGITNEDTTIASLKALITDLEIQIGALTQRVNDLDLTAKEAVARKNRVSALAALKSRKLAESTLAKRQATLSQLEEVFAKIEQAVDQVELVRVMEGSTKVLSGLNKQIGGVERVDNVLDELREQMSHVDEVGNVIAEAGQASDAFDEIEVDEELEVIEREDRQKREETERLETAEKDMREAEETIRKLDTLKKVERQTADAKQADEQGDVAEAMEESTQEMQRMSL